MAGRRGGSFKRFPFVSTPKFWINIMCAQNTYVSIYLMLALPLIASGCRFLPPPHGCVFQVQQSGNIFRMCLPCCAKRIIGRSVWSVPVAVISNRRWPLHRCFWGDGACNNRIMNDRMQVLSYHFERANVLSSDTRSVGPSVCSAEPLLGGFYCFTNMIRICIYIELWLMNFPWIWSRNTFVSWKYPTHHCVITGLSIYPNGRCVVSTIQCARQTVKDGLRIPTVIMNLFTKVLHGVLLFRILLVRLWQW